MKNIKARITATGIRDGKKENIEIRKYADGKIVAFRNGEESYKVFYDIKMGIGIHKLRVLQNPWIYNPDENSIEAFMFILYKDFLIRWKNFTTKETLTLKGRLLTQTLIKFINLRRQRNKNKRTLDLSRLVVTNRAFFAFSL